MNRQTRELIFEELCNKDPVMLFSFGKAGTTSLFAALQEYYDGQIVWAEYRKSDLVDDLLSRYIDGIAGSRNAPSRMDSRLKVITPIRDPIGRDVASFYEATIQNYLGVRKRSDPSMVRRALAGMAGSLHPTFKSAIRRAVNQWRRQRQGSSQRQGGYVGENWLYEECHVQQLNNLTPQQLRDIFLEVHFERFPRRNSSETTPKAPGADWFDKHYIPNLKTDVYAKEFPAQRVAYYSTNRADMMIFDYSLDNERKAQLIRDFLGIERFEIGYSRVTAEKNTAIADSYALFKKQVKFPNWYLDRMLNSRYFQHFYTRQDEERLREQWAE